MAADALILLVEDEALIRMLLEETLDDAGSRTVVASTGQQALAELESDAARFQAVVTDIRLGRGPDGWEVGRRARELVPTMPVVYVSGDSSHEWVSRGVPGSIMVSKPFRPGEVVTAVAMVVDQADTC